MRNLTAYEAKKWGLGYDFKSPEWLHYGDETGEYYDTFVAAYRSALNNNNGELAAALQVEALDMYYADVEWHLTAAEGDYDDVILPPYIEFEKKYESNRAELINKVGKNDKVASYLLSLNDLALKMALDWAVEWGKENHAKVWDQRRADQLRSELKRLEKRSGV